MLLWPFLLFVLVPALELSLLIRAGSVLGAGATLALILLTGVVGAALARSQGVQTLVRIRSSLAAGRLPGAELAQGAVLLAGGLLLLTPGFLTDAVGFSLMIPAVRRIVVRRLGHWFERRAQVVTVHRGYDPAPFDRPTHPTDGVTVDAEYSVHE